MISLDNSNRLLHSRAAANPKKNGEKLLASVRACGEGHITHIKCSVIKQSWGRKFLLYQALVKLISVKIISAFRVFYHDSII